MKQPPLVLWSLWLAGACGHEALTANDAGPGVDAGLATDLPPAACRWQGYGIGEHGSCDEQHLLAHNAVECQAAGGFPVATRGVAGHCASGVEESQLSCCFRGAIPAPASTPVASVDPLDRRAAPGPGGATRETLTADAESACVAVGSHLGDWSVLYAADGSTPALLRFACVGAMLDTVSVRASGRTRKFAGPTQVFPECIDGHKGFGAQVGGDRIHLDAFVFAPGRYQCGDPAPYIFLDWEGGDAAAEYQIGVGHGGPCELVIESIRPRFRGTFTATLARTLGDGPEQMTLTEGSFDIAGPPASCP